MEMPKPTPQHARLSALAGSWLGEETMHPSPWDPKGGTATGHMRCRMELEGMYLIGDYHQERGGHVTYRGHDVIGWDPKRSLYTMYWFDSMGIDPGGPATGSWQGDTLSFEMASELGHSRYVYVLKEDGRYDFSISMSRDGQDWRLWLESRWTRQADR